MQSPIATARLPLSQLHEFLAQLLVPTRPRLVAPTRHYQNWPRVLIFIPPKSRLGGRARPRLQFRSLNSAKRAEDGPTAPDTLKGLSAPSNGAGHSTPNRRLASTTGLTTVPRSYANPQIAKRSKHGGLSWQGEHSLTPPNEISKNLNGHKIAESLIDAGLATVPKRCPRKAKSIWLFDLYWQILRPVTECL
jgi:hypothetical protein